MKKIISTLIITAAMCFATSAQAIQVKIVKQSAASSQQTRKDTVQLFKWIRFYATKKQPITMAGMKMHYDKGVVFICNGLVEARSRKQLFKHFRALLAGVNKFEVSPNETIITSGNQAAINYSFTITDKAGQKHVHPTVVMITFKNHKVKTWRELSTEV